MSPSRAMKVNMYDTGAAVVTAAVGATVGVSGADTTETQGLTLVPLSAQLQLFCQPCKSTQVMNVCWSC